VFSVVPDIVYNTKSSGLNSLDILKCPLMVLVLSSIVLR
jgi:hypothetical protein